MTKNKINWQGRQRIDQGHFGLLVKTKDFKNGICCFLCFNAQHL